METFLAILAIAVLIYGLRYTRRKAISQEADIQKSVERVRQQSINLSDYGTITNVRMELRDNLRPANEDETTPPLADETYTPQEPTIWDIEIEKYFSKESE